MVGLWLSLAVFLAAITGGIAFAGLRGWRLWKLAKRTGATLGTETERITAVTAEIERRTAEAAAAAARLQEASARLAVSRARLELQLAAVREARARVRRTFWFVPGL